MTFGPGGDSRSMPGPDAITRALVFTSSLQRADIDPQTRARLLKALGDTVPIAPLQPGGAAVARSLPPDALKLVIPSAAVVAAGLDLAQVTPPAAPVVWAEGGNQLLVRIGEVRADLGDGAIVVTVPVSCDETGPVEVNVSFITGTPDRPAAGVATTEDHPRGPAPIVENWAEPLIAFAWHTLVIATGSLSGAGGNDLSGRDLITAGFGVTPNGITVTPMGRHTFLALGATP